MEVFYYQDNEDEDEVQYLTRDSALEVARKIEKSTVIETKMGIKLKRNNTDD